MSVARGQRCLAGSTGQRCLPVVTSLQSEDENVCSQMLHHICLTMRLKDVASDAAIINKEAVSQRSRVEHPLSSFRLPQSGGDMIDPYDIPSPPIPHAPNPPPANPPPYPGLRGK